MKRTIQVLLASGLAASPLSWSIVYAQEGQPQGQPQQHPQAQPPPQQPQAKAQPGTPGPAEMRFGTAEERQVTDSELMGRIRGFDTRVVDMARLAQDKGSTKEVRDFAAKLVEDHQKSNEELGLVAKQINRPIASMPPGTKAEEIHTQLMERLKAVSGPDFDRVFLLSVAAGHDFAIDMMAAQAYGHNVAKGLFDYVKKTISKLDDHRRTAVDLLGKEAERRYQQPAG